MKTLVARGRNAVFSIILAVTLDVLALDGVFDLGLSAVLDAFQTANELTEMSGIAAPRFQVRVVGMRKIVKTAQGLTVPVPRDRQAVPGLRNLSRHLDSDAGPLETALARTDVQRPATRCGNGGAVAR